MTSTSSDDRRYLISEYARRFEARDVAGVLELLTDDCTIEMPLRSEPVTGKQALEEFFLSLMNLWKNYSERVVSTVVENERGVAELEFAGSLESGASVVIESVDVFRFRGNKIHQIKVYTDTAPIRTMMSNETEIAALQTQRD
jgi:ketosteroid isomerase-like protein